MSRAFCYSSLQYISVVKNKWVKNTCQYFSCYKSLLFQTNGYTNKNCIPLPLSPIDLAGLDTPPLGRVFVCILHFSSFFLV